MSKKPVGFADLLQPYLRKMLYEENRRSEALYDRILEKVVSEDEAKKMKEQFMQLGIEVPEGLRHDG